MASVPSCASGGWICRIECRAGDAASCLGLAYAADANPESKQDAPGLYRSACLLGAANACTNYAASIWAAGASGGELACVRRTFEKACAVEEPFACGMVGRVMLESTTPPAYTEGRRYLEKACDRIGGFSCRVLAKHLKSGNLGSYPPELIDTLLGRACDGGDPNACGEHATASETFE